MGIPLVIKRTSSKLSSASLKALATCLSSSGSPNGSNDNNDTTVSDTSSRTTEIAVGHANDDKNMSALYSETHELVLNKDKNL